MHSFGEGVEGVAGLFLAGAAADGELVPANLHRAFGTGEHEAFAFIASIYEIHTQRQVEALGIIKQTQEHIIGITAVLPEAEAAGCHAAGGTVASRDEVGSTEEVDEEISGDSGAIGFAQLPDGEDGIAHSTGPGSAATASSFISP